MKIIGQLSEEDLKAYNSGDKSVLKKYLKEEHDFEYSDLSEYFPKTYKLVREFRKKFDALERQLDKQKYTLGRPVIKACEEEIKSLKNEYEDVDDQDIADELYVIFEGFKDLM